jgi:cyclopropane fatty-acyl-phospholipid synthase-like methyltransferase
MAHKPKRSLARLFFGKVPDDQIQRAYRIRVVLFFALVVILIKALFLSYQLNQIFSQFYLAEAQRDSWQRPGDIIEALKLKDGSVVADLGCRVGYFSLKLAPKVAERGSVLAEDILGESLPLITLLAT